MTDKSIVLSKQMREFFVKDNGIPMQVVEDPYPSAHVLETKLKNGSKYTFMNVPPNVYQDFLKSPSKGTFFNYILRQDFSGQ